MNVEFLTNEHGLGANRFKLFDAFKQIEQI